MDGVRYEAYADVAATIGDDQLEGFFDGWPTRPSVVTFRAVLAGSHGAWVARLAEGEVVGFVTVVSDGVLSACLTLLEVRPARRGEGIGSALVAHALRDYDEMYMVDVVCDEELVPFYSRFGLRPLRAMSARRPDVLGRG